jgi:hypothetical protein
MENHPNPHHLILGNLNDFLTGVVLIDTYDERYRQKIAKKLVLDGGFEKKDIQRNVTTTIAAGKQKAQINIDFIVKFQKKSTILVKYSPGSIVTRRISTIALSRIAESYQIPIAVITNGEDAEILDGNSGRVLKTGFHNLPDKEMLKRNMTSFLFEPVKKTIFEKASRIVFACEIEGACPCDSDICIID